MVSDNDIKVKLIRLIVEDNLEQATAEFNLLLGRYYKNKAAEGAYPPLDKDEFDIISNSVTEHDIAARALIARKYRDRTGYSMQIANAVISSVLDTLHR
jgi:hypothetical protein